jgi:hypothetical protein
MRSNWFLKAVKKYDIVQFSSGCSASIEVLIDTALAAKAFIAARFFTALREFSGQKSVFVREPSQKWIAALLHDMPTQAL